MKEILPLVIICALGIAACAVFAVLEIIKIKRGEKKADRIRKEEFELSDEEVLTINLDG